MCYRLIIVCLCTSVSGRENTSQGPGRLGTVQADTESEEERKEGRTCAEGERDRKLMNRWKARR